MTTRNHNRKLTHFSSLTWVMGRRKVPQPQCRLTCWSWPSSGSCSLSPLGQFHQEKHRFCHIIMDRRARMLCHLRDGCTGSLQSSVSKYQGRVKSSKPLSLPADTPKRKCWERRDVSIERAVPAHKLAFRQDIHRVHFSQKSSNPQTLRFCNKFFKIFTKQMLCSFAKEKVLASRTDDTIWAVGQQEMRLSDLAGCSGSLLFSAFKNFPSLLPQLLSISKLSYLSSSGCKSYTVCITRKSIILIKSK